MNEILLLLAFGLSFGIYFANRRITALEKRLNALEADAPSAQTIETPEALRQEIEPTEAETAKPGPWGARQESPQGPLEEEVTLATESPPTDMEQQEAMPETETNERPRQSFESRFGARWPVWIGGLALALGGIFMVKYSIESGLLNPVVRLVMASAFGLALLIAGEWVRRREMPLDLPAIKNALVPGILTAAGLVTLLGAAFAAHAFYGFIGPTTAFILLAMISLGGVGLSLLHGQGLAGLGLLAAMATPALIDSPEPNYWALFVYLTVAWIATALASRIRGWNIVPAAANVLLLGWSGAVLSFGEDVGIWPVIVAQMAAIAGLTFLWPASHGEAPDNEDVAETELVDAPWHEWARGAFRNNGHLSLSITGAMAALLVGLGLLNTDGDSFGRFAIVLAGLGFWAAWRPSAFPAVIATGIGVVLASVAPFAGMLEAWLQSGNSGWIVGHTPGVEVFYLAATLVLLGVLAISRHAATFAAYSLAWAALMTVGPMVLLSASFIAQGAFALDWPHGLSALALAVCYLTYAEFLWRRKAGGAWHDAHIFFMAAGSFFAAVLALHAITNSVTTTILTAVIGFAYLAAGRMRPWAVVPWILAFAGIVVLARIAWQPSLVGDLTLSKTPFFNQLLPGYGIPALLLGAGAYLVRAGTSERVRNFLQALASLMALMTVAILARHALNNGSLSGGEPTLGEQSIYTLLTVGASAVLMTLDMKSPSPVFRWGSMIAGGLSMAGAVFAHLLPLNPYFSGELTGSYPVFNLLLLGYLLPALAFFGLAYYARGKRPVFYVRTLAAAGTILAFAWVTLSVRRFWQGAGIADWKGFMQGEMYTYSVVWLILGVILLGVGSRFNAVSLRLASAALVLVAVLKVFIIDMSNLEGFLRALSFIGLGIVLIGIGLFYQRVLARRSDNETVEP